MDYYYFISGHEEITERNTYQFLQSKTKSQIQWDDDTLTIESRQMFEMKYYFFNDHEGIDGQITQFFFLTPKTESQLHFFHWCSSCNRYEFLHYQFDYGIFRLRYIQINSRSSVSEQSEI